MLRIYHFNKHKKYEFIQLINLTMQKITKHKACENILCWEIRSFVAYVTSNLLQFHIVVMIQTASAKLGNPPVIGTFSHKEHMTRGFDVFIVSQISLGNI